MPLLLNIETSTEICSVCLSKGQKVLALKETHEKYAHAKAITLLIEACLEETNRKLKELEAVVISSGPGSYTALRIGTSTAKGICYALEKPLIAIDTLQALALAAIRKIGDETALYCPMIDARRMEVYAAVYDHSLKEIESTQAIILDEHSYAEYFNNKKTIYFFGDGSSKFTAVQKSPIAHFPNIPLSSTNLIPLGLKAYETGQFSDPAYFSPFYFKAPNITQSKKTL